MASTESNNISKTKLHNINGNKYISALEYADVQNIRTVFYKDKEKLEFRFQNFKLLISPHSSFIRVNESIYHMYLPVVYDGNDSIWSYLGITGAIYFTGAISVILFGIYWDKASSAGAIAALIGGLSALFGLEPIRESIPMISGMKPEEIGLLTLLITIILMVGFSILLPDRKERISL